jgi:hypothetical protein
MADTSKNAIQAMMKSFTDIVTPAVDPLDPIALEQLQSAVKYLEFLGERIDFVYDRERFELGHHVAMGEALAQGARKAAPRIAAALAADVEAGAQTYRQLGAGIPQMRDRTAALTATIRDLVIAAQDADPEVRRAIERIIIDDSGSRILLDRAWYCPLGFEHSPGDVPALATALASQQDVLACRRRRDQNS